MDNLDSTVSPESQEEELSHSDKMIGIFSEPSSTFEKISKFPPKTIDWFLPIFLLLVFVALSQIFLRTNPEIAYQIRQKQIEVVDKGLKSAVEKGQITQEQADQRRDAAESQMEKMSGGVVGSILIIAGSLIGGFIFFFIMAGIYFLFAKFALKGNGTYTGVLVACGIPSYIGIVMTILLTIIAMLMSKLLPDLSLGAFMDAEKSTLAGWALAKIDIFSIWIYIVISIGLAKMFKSASTTKYYAVVFGIWIIGGLIMHFIAQSLPFLRSTGM